MITIEEVRKNPSDYICFIESESKQLWCGIVTKVRKKREYPIEYNKSDYSYMNLDHTFKRNEELDKLYELSKKNNKLALHIWRKIRKNYLIKK
jgi:hypothetical protein